jgi:hypothetical protein
MRTLLRRTSVVAVLLLVAAPLFAHDMFLRLEQFFVAPNTTVNVRLFNGTFILSENSITPDRLADIAVVSPAGRAKIDVAQWSAAGDTSVFPMRTGAAGTYVVGVSTKPRVLEMSGTDFNAYLRSDGIPDELAARRAQKRLNDRAKERYQKDYAAWSNNAAKARAEGKPEPSRPKLQQRGLQRLIQNWQRRRTSPD